MKKQKYWIIVLTGIILAFVIGNALLQKNKINSPIPMENPSKDNVSITIQPMVEPSSVLTTMPNSAGDLIEDGIDLAEEPWKVAYINYIQNTLNADPWAGYELILIDNDNVPELIAFGSSEAQGNQVINYYEGTVYSTQLSRLGFCYIEKGNLLNNSEGHMDYYYDIIYSIIDGKLTQIGAGYWGALDDSKPLLTEDGTLTYQYLWEGKSVTKEEYQQSLNSIFDMSKATDGYIYPAFSSDEIIKMIEDYK